MRGEVATAEIAVERSARGTLGRRSPYECKCMTWLLVCALIVMTAFYVTARGMWITWCRNSEAVTTGSVIAWQRAQVVTLGFWPNGPSYPLTSPTSGESFGDVPRMQLSCMLA